MARFAKNVGVSITGVIVASAISLVLLPIVTRTYLPDVIGVWQVLFTAASVFVPLATLRFESAIVIEDDKNVGEGLLAASVAMTILVVVSCVFVLEVYRESVLRYFQLSAAHQIYALPLVVVMTSGFQVFSGFLIKHEKFGQIALIKVSSSFVLPIVAISLAWVDEPSIQNYLIAGCCLYLFQAIATGCVARRWSNLRSCLSGISHMAVATRKHQAYPKFMVPYALTQSLVLQLTAGGMAYIYSPAVVGAYFVAQQIVNVPVTVVAAGLRNVLFSFSAKNIADRPDLVSDVIEKITLYVLVLVVPIACFAFFFSTPLLVLLLGEDWLQAAEFSKWIIVSGTTGVLVSWMDRQFEVVGKHKLSVFLEILRNVGLIVVFYVAYRFEISATNFVLSLAFYAAVFNIVWLMVLLLSIGFGLGALVRYLIVLASEVCIFYFLSHMIFKSYNLHDYIWFGSLLFVFSSMYAVSLLLVFNNYKRALT